MFVNGETGTTQLPWHRDINIARDRCHIRTPITVVSSRNVPAVIMDPSMLAAVYVAFSPFYFLSSTALNMAKAVDQFRPVFIPPDGPILCGVGPPTTYFTWLENFRLCSYKCTFLRDQCWFFNFKDPPCARSSSINHRKSQLKNIAFCWR